LLSVLAFADVQFKETFETDPLGDGGWTLSDWKKSDGQQGKWTWETGPFNTGDADKGLKTSEDAKFYAISKKFDKFSNAGKTLVVQFQIRHPQDIDCGGGYIKLLGSDYDPAKFNGETPYSVMFGPDICGATKRIHTILNVKGENKLIKNTLECESGQTSAVYRLVLNSDDTFKVTMNGQEKASGKIKDNWDIEKPAKIPDPSKPKPKDWVDAEEIDDPKAEKPAEWDQPKKITDPKATKPEDWDDSDDGEWEAPMIDNPDYKGEWKAKRIKNPAYKGPYVQPEIDNPDYVEEKDVYKFDDIGGVGIELWQVKAGTVFDNIIIADSEADADAFLKDTCADYKCGEAEQKVKDAQDAEAEKIRKAAEEEAKKKEEAEKKAEEAKEGEKEGDS